MQTKTRFSCTPTPPQPHPAFLAHFIPPPPPRMPPPCPPSLSDKTRTPPTLCVRPRSRLASFKYICMSTYVCRNPGRIAPIPPQLPSIDSCKTSTGFAGRHMHRLTEYG
uniref:Uncharacterized protein n=1 Tax=Morchella brunnea TaxID=1174671 RepID=A0A8K1I7T0_9PEZI|nr:hypothetical protein LK370_mgp008 [Morchella brunnea]UBU98414.1 hypothetical protein [Morchella brunnea]